MFNFMYSKEITCMIRVSNSSQIGPAQ